MADVFIFFNVSQLIVVAAFCIKLHPISEKGIKWGGGGGSRCSPRMTVSSQFIRFNQQLIRSSFHIYKTQNEKGNIKNSVHQLALDRLIISVYIIFIYLIVRRYTHINMRHIYIFSNTFFLITYDDLGS